MKTKGEKKKKRNETLKKKSIKDAYEQPSLYCGREKKHISRAKLKIQTCEVERLTTAVIKCDCSGLKVSVL